MSNWDFGFTDPAAGHRDSRQPPDGAAADDTWEGADLAQYPLTYERGRPGPSPSQPTAPPGEPWPPAPPPADQFAGGEVPAAQAGNDQFDGETWLHAPPSRQRPAGNGPPGWPDFSSGDGFGDTFGSAPDGQQWPPGEDRRDRRSGRPARPGRRWVVLAGIAAAGAATVSALLLTRGHHGAPATAAPASPARASQPAGHPRGSSPAASVQRPPITMAQARGVLAGYTTVNNNANAQRSDARLTTIETGSSFAIDAGLYRVQQAAGVSPYPAFGPVRATYYIPRAEPASGPRWFVVRVANAFFSTPGKIASTEYLLFTQSAPGAPWRNTIEPYLLSGADTPGIAVGQDGLATAVSATATALAVAPGHLAARTAGSLDRTAATGTAVTSAANLADQSDLRFWRGKLPTAAITDTHTPATAPDGQEFALLTTDGGALVFYTDAATLTLTPPSGTKLHLTVPGLYSPAQALPGARLSYLDQFAAYDPPASAGTPRVVAAYSGLTGKS